MHSLDQSYYEFFLHKLEFEIQAAVSCRSAH